MLSVNRTMLTDRDAEQIAMRAVNVAMGNIADLLPVLVADRVVEAIAGLFPEEVERDQILDAHGAAALLGCSVATIERRTRDGSIPSLRIGRLRRYRRADLLALNAKGGPSDA